MVSKLGLEPEDQDYMFSEDTVKKLVKHGFTNEEFESPYIEQAEAETHESVTQEQEVWTWLNEHGSITDKEARDHLYISRLAARIWNLRHRDGFDIPMVMVTRRRVGRRAISFAKYYIESDAD